MCTDNVNVQEARVEGSDKVSGFPADEVSGFLRSTADFINRLADRLSR